jgi:hypothetical protein
MSHYLSEDPWPLVTLLGVVALGFLVAAWLTQQGKHVVFAGITLSLALVVIGIEQLWVTDNERIERIVYDLGRAAQSSNSDQVISYLAPEAAISTGDDLRSRQFGRFSRVLTVQGIREALRRIRFDFVNISNLTVHAGSLSRQGTAEFQSKAVGSYDASVGEVRFPLTVINWSLGFRETSPGVWKVTRITPINPPSEFEGPFGIPQN